MRAGSRDFALSLPVIRPQIHALYRMPLKHGSCCAGANPPGGDRMHDARSGFAAGSREPRRRIDVATKRAGPIDAMVGRTIRMLRLSKGISQGALGRRLGVSFQQVQKYENGTNRVGAGRLAQISSALDVPLESLLQGVETGRRKPRSDDDPMALLSSSQAMRLARAFSKIGDGRIRVALVSLAEGIASEGR